MTGREKNLILVGAIVGILLASIFYYGLAYERRQKAEVRADTTSNGQANIPDSAASHKDTQAGIAVNKAGMKMDAPVESAAETSVELTQDEEKTLGVQTSEVKKRNVKQELRSLGKVEEAETQLSTISARIGGRLDKLMVQFTGQNVHKGQAVASIYSPELVTSAEEYRLALDNLERLHSDAVPDAVEQAKQLVAASKRRLELWGLTLEQIHEIEKGDQSKIHITIYSQTNGTVTERKVTEGQYVKEGDVLFMLSDLSRVWVKAEVFEANLPSIRLGQAVELSGEGLAKKLQGRVNFIEPMVNQQTRTVPIRIEVTNLGMQLRPGMFVQAIFREASQGEVLSVPRTAVVDTGTHKIVYVAKGNGSYEGRTIEVGTAGDDFYPVLTGLKQGERVVTQGAFLIDSQTRLTGGLSGQFGGSKEFTRDTSSPATSAGSGYQITFKPEPGQAKGGTPAIFHVAVMDQAGKTVTDAELNVHLFMPAMPSMGMGAQEQNVPLAWKGTEYSGTTTIPTAGLWNVTVEAKRNGKRIAVKQARMNAK